MPDSTVYYALIKEAYNYFKLPVSVVKRSGETLYFFPEGERPVLPKTVVRYELDCFRNSQITGYLPFMRTTPYDSFLGIIPLPSQDYLVVGPAFTRPFSPSRITTYSKEQITKDELSALYQATRKSPTIDSRYFADVLSMLILVFYYQRISAADILAVNHLLEEKSSNYTASVVVEKDYDMLLFFESRVYSAVQAGNIVELTELWEQFSTNLRKDTEERMYYEHHLMIPLLSTARYASLAGGAPKEQIVSIFHTCITKITVGESLSINSKLVEQATYDFCTLVKKSKKAPYQTELCIMCEHYIDEHISEKITAAGMAKHCGVDRSLIFTIFRENYGISLTDYIQNERLRRAKVLLLHSRYSISEIASSLGYGSASYFSKVFAKYCGCTPNAYRKQPPLMH